MKKNYKYLLKNIGFLMISQFASKFLSFFLVPLYTNILTPEEYGIYDLVATTIYLLIPIATLNIGEAVIVFTLDKKNDKSQVLSLSLKYAMIGTFIGCFLSLLNNIIGLLPELKSYWYYLPMLLFVNVISTDFSYFARGIDHVKDTAIGGTLTSFLTIILNIHFLVYMKIGIHGYFLANILGLFAQCIYLFFSCRLWQYFRIVSNKKFEHEMTEYSKPLILNTVAWWINGSLDKYIIIYFCSIADNGIYSVASKIPSIINVFQTIFNQAWTISAVKDFDSKDKNGFFSSTYKAYNCMMVLLCSLIIVFDKILARFLYSNDFYEAWEYVPWLTISIVFGALSGYLGGVFSAVKESKVFAKSTIFGAATNLLLNVVLTPYYGPMGAAIGTAVGYLVVWILRYVYAKRYICFAVSIKKHILSYLVLISQAILLLIVDDEVKMYGMQLLCFTLLTIIYCKDIVVMFKSIYLKL